VYLWLVSQSPTHRHPHTPAVSNQQINQQACIDDGLLLVAAGPTVVRFVPPLIVTEAEVDEAVKRCVLFY
jgi:acetylornithine aminotransferase